MLNVYTVSFFGHRDFCEHYKYAPVLDEILTDLARTKEYVEFLVGRNGEFDSFAASSVRRLKQNYDSNVSLNLVLPYLTAEYKKNQESFDSYYDVVEICEKSASAHFKAAMQIRNREMASRSDLIICYISKHSGGAYQTIRFAEKSGRKLINLFDYDI